MGQTDRRTDGQTDRQTTAINALCPLSMGAGHNNGSRYYQ